MQSRPTGRASEVVETGQPEQCANGHPMPRPLVAYLPCACRWPERGHRTYRCRDCGDTSHFPPHAETEPVSEHALRRRPGGP